MNKMSADRPPMRRIALRLLSGRPLHRSYLRWNDGTDLVPLDKRVDFGG